MADWSNYLLPILFLFVLLYALKNRVKVFDVFLHGAEKGLQSAIKILPSLVGLVCAVSMLRACGIFEYLTALLSPVLNRFRFPTEVLPLAMLKPFSGSGGLALIKDLFSSHGTDSFIGTFASVMLGSSETTFYALTVYFGSVKVTNTRYTLRAAILADFIGIGSAFFITLLFYPFGA